MFFSVMLRFFNQKGCMLSDKPTILLVNPPIYDFTAYDFWVKPYGLLRVGGRLRGRCRLLLWDYLDRFCPENSADGGAAGTFGRGKFRCEKINKPSLFEDIPRHFYRFGKPRESFISYLKTQPPADVVLVATMMTYWYPGVQEVISDIRRIWPRTPIILGGFYASFLPQHAAQLGADEMIIGENFSNSRYLAPLCEQEGLPCWELYPVLKTAVLTLTVGCPFRCAYCSVSLTKKPFTIRPLAQVIEELKQILRLGATDVAFYDDALLFKAHEGIIPFLDTVLQQGYPVRFHTPNGLHARFLTKPIAQKMVRAGFRTFYIGYESSSPAFHQQDGGKITPEDLLQARDALYQANALKNAVVYEMLGHPRLDPCQLENSMKTASQLGFQIMLSDFSPLPKTPDGELCGDKINLAEPLNHNKTVFPIRLLGFEQVNQFKDLCRQLNRSVRQRGV